MQPTNQPQEILQIHVTRQDSNLGDSQHGGLENHMARCYIRPNFHHGWPYPSGKSRTNYWKPPLSPSGPIRGRKEWMFRSWQFGFWDRTGRPEGHASCCYLSRDWTHGKPTHSRLFSKMSQTHLRTMVLEDESQHLPEEIKSPRFL